MGMQIKLIENEEQWTEFEAHIAGAYISRTPALYPCVVSYYEEYHHDRDIIRHYQLIYQNDFKKD